MNVTLLDDYQDVVRTLPCFALMQGHRITVFNDPAADTGTLVRRLQDTEALLLFRERTAITREILKASPDQDLELCASLISGCFESADYAEGRTAFMQKRNPVFTGH